VASQIYLASTKPRFDQNCLSEFCSTLPPLCDEYRHDSSEPTAVVISKVRHRVVDYSLAAILHRRDLHLSEDVREGAYKSPPCRVDDKSEGRSRWTQDPAGICNLVNFLPPCIRKSHPRRIDLEIRGCR
jgi:hypothetical protein